MFFKRGLATKRRQNAKNTLHRIEQATGELWTHQRIHSRAETEEHQEKENEKLKVLALRRSHYSDD